VQSDTNPYKLDIDKAKALLAEAGYPDGFSKVYYATPVTPEYEVAQSLQANAAKAGIKLELQGGDHIGKFRARDFELFSARSGERLPDPHAVLQSYATNANNTDEAKLTGLNAWRTAWDVPKDIQDMVIAAAHETGSGQAQRTLHQDQQGLSRVIPGLDHLVPAHRRQGGPQGGQGLCRTLDLADALGHGFQGRVVPLGGE
jgi:ABC-type transport system substrate-binding protein